MKNVLFLFLILSNISFILTVSSQCGSETIDHCIKCKTGDLSDTCLTCEPNYFLFFNDLLCLPFNHSLYGQVECDKPLIINSTVLCEKDGCKEGYYNSNGFCKRCYSHENGYGCIKCKVEGDETNQTFTCLECDSTYFDRHLTDDGKCKTCEGYCEKCSFNPDFNEQTCYECSKGYFLNSEGECQRCYYQVIEEGLCHICSENSTNFNSCFCKDGYALTEENKCVKCDENCSLCTYNVEKKEMECLRCDKSYNYVLDSNHKCVYCGKRCGVCTLDSKDNPICLSCSTSSYLDNDNGVCLNCGSRCSSCTLNKSNGKEETICTQCKKESILEPKNNTCIRCRDVPELGPGCEDCIYNKTLSQPQCLSCLGGYAFINNTNQCIYSNSKEDKNIYGCKKAYYDEKNNKYICTSCRSGFTPVKNENICIKGLDSCLQAENLGTFEDPLYSCIVCDSNYFLITDSDTGRKSCYSSYLCSEGIIEDEEIKCNKCVENATLNSDGGCECNKGYDEYSGSCYKCDDESGYYYGNTACVAEEGCTSSSLYKDKVRCNKCKEGYYETEKGVCNYCPLTINNCITCHYEESSRYYFCDSCLSTYIVNDDGLCELNECEEYPEISPGCIICKDVLEQYKPNNKCQTCKYGYFKTKEEKCVYCRSENYGGPGCYECDYEKDSQGKDTNNIICKDCYSVNNYEFDIYQNISYENYYLAALNSKGKCYNYDIKNNDSCFKYEFIQKNNVEQLLCTICIPGYYLNSDNKCVSFKDKIKLLPYCRRHDFSLGKKKFYFNYEGDKDFKVLIDFIEREYFDNFAEINDIIIKSKEISTTCNSCQTGYVKDKDTDCYFLSLEKCTINNMLNVSNKLSEHCEEICSEYNYPIINVPRIISKYELHAPTVGPSSEILIGPESLLSFFSRIISFRDRELPEDYEKLFFDIPLCYNLSSSESRIKFNHCEIITYLPEKKSYKCDFCEKNYEYDKEKQLCVLSNNTKSQEKLCNLDNIGNEYTNSCYSCIENIQTLVTYENGVSICIKNPDLNNCEEALANTTYYNTLYNCTLCKNKYIEYYSKFYGKQKCFNISEKVIKYQNISLAKFDNETYINADNKGTCEKNYFTPDNKRCYNCNSSKVGMPGCKGECSFSLNRSEILLCKEGCKEGYLEVSEGICQSCSALNEGCSKCHYDKNYAFTDAYFGLISNESQGLKCDSCIKGYVRTPSGICSKCSDLISGCKECVVDSKGEYKCTKCFLKYYGINEYNGLNKCEKCVVNRFIKNNKCLNCSDVAQGGIDHCNYCEETEGKISCKECLKGYILSIDDNICLERTKELEPFNDCLQLIKENDKYICSKCDPKFSLVKIGTELKCHYVPTLFDYNFQGYYYDHYIIDIFLKKIISMVIFLLMIVFIDKENYYLAKKQ